MRAIIATGPLAEDISAEEINQILNTELIIQEVNKLEEPAKYEKPVIYTGIEPEDAEDVFKLYHFAVYPHYLNNIPGIYVIKNPKTLFNKLESIADPPPISCPLTGEKTVRQFKRMKTVKNKEDLINWLRQALKQDNVEVQISTPLAPDQEQAATHFLGPALGVAPAGSGKTSSLITRNVVLVKRKVPPDKILCITFTKKAQSGMQERLIEALGKDIGSKIMVKTEHALAYYLLKKFNKVKNLDIISDRTAILNEILSQGEYNTEIKDIDQYISNMMNELMEPRDIEPKVELEKEYIDLYQKYMDTLKERGIYCQDYLLFNLYQTLRDDKEKRQFLMDYKQNNDPNYPSGFWQFIMIDEAQDNNRAQDILIQFLTPWDNILWVGDDDQSLYSFRGSSVERFLNLPNIYPNLREIYLKVNYRCHPDIVQAGNNVIQFNKVRKPKEIIAHRKDTYRAIKAAFFPDTISEAGWVTTQIKELLKGGNFGPDDIAILYRTNNQGDTFAELLAKQEIPHIINRNGPSLWESIEMEAIINHISVAVNIHNTNALLNCLRLPCRTEHYEYYKKELQGKPYALDTLKTLADNKKDYRVAEFCEDMRIANLITQGLPNTGEIINLIRSRLKDFEKYFMGKEGYDRFDIIEDLGIKFNNPDDFIKWVQKVKTRNKDEDIVNGVRLMTVHSSKGLEFPVVFLVNCNDGKFPHDNGDKEEERRIFYVGITRARDYLYFTGYRTDKRGLSEFLWEAEVLN